MSTATDRMAAPANPLAPELEFFKENREKFLNLYKGNFLVIKNRTLQGGSFSNFKDAFNYAIQHFGTEPVLIKQVLDPEPKTYFLGVPVR